MIPMNKWLAPSSIHFLKVHKQLIDDTDDNPVNELSKKLSADLMSVKVPKMQVAEKDGNMFALNNSSLQLMRQLEKQGKLHHGLIQVEVVPLSKVPANIQMAMIADTDSSTIQDQNIESFVCPIDQHQSDINDSTKERISHKTNPEVDIKANSGQVGQGGSQTNTASDEESDREDYDEENEEEADDNEDGSDGSSTSDEAMQCNVCDRTFASATLLGKHQIKKKHFGCSVCDTVFPSLRALEEHKEILDHWSDDENPLTDDDEQNAVKPQREELERLL